MLGLSLIFFVFGRTFASEGVWAMDCHASIEEWHLWGVIASSGMKLCDS